jgi:dynein heavy chain
VISFLSIVSGVLSLDSVDSSNSAVDNSIQQQHQQQHQQQQQQLHGAALFALFWSLGSLTNPVSRQKFTSLFWQLIIDDGAKTVENFESLPNGCNVYDWKFDVHLRVWHEWSRDLPTISISPSADPSSIIVPTVDGLSYQAMLMLLLSARAHVLLVGGTGTGKTVVVTRTLLEGLPVNWHNHMMALSARSTANSLQDSIDRRFEKRRKGVYGPPLGRRMAVFVDDMNMPVRESFGASPCAEILRQLVGQGGWYDRQELMFR